MTGQTLSIGPVFALCLSAWGQSTPSAVGEIVEFNVAVPTGRFLVVVKTAQEERPALFVRINKDTLGVLVPNLEALRNKNATPVTADVVLRTQKDTRIGTIQIPPTNWRRTYEVTGT